MASLFQVPLERLTWRCDPSLPPFACTADITRVEDFGGQERAMRAIEFGLGVNKPGFNIFVTGLTGTGKTTIIKAFLKQVTAEKTPPGADSPFPEDWCYVYNFSDPDRPQTVNIRRGWGKILKKDMEVLVQTIQREAKKTFESEEFARQRQVNTERTQKQQQENLQAMMSSRVDSTRVVGLAIEEAARPPLKNGKPMQEEEYLALSPEEKKELEEKGSEIEKKE